MTANPRCEKHNVELETLPGAVSCFLCDRERMSGLEAALEAEAQSSRLYSSIALRVKSGLEKMRAEAHKGAISMSLDAHEFHEIEVMAEAALKLADSVENDLLDRIEENRSPASAQGPLHEPAEKVDVTFSECPKCRTLLLELRDGPIHVIDCLATCPNIIPAAPPPVAGEGPQPKTWSEYMEKYGREEYGLAEGTPKLEEREKLQEAIRASLAEYFQIREVAPDRFRLFIDAGAGEKNLSSHYGLEDATRNRDWLAGRIANRLSHDLRPFITPACQNLDFYIKGGLGGTLVELGQTLGEVLIKAGVLHGEFPLTVAELIHAAKDYCATSTGEANGWISVEERLPEIVEEFGGVDNKLYGSSVPVLALSDTFQRVAYYYKSGIWDSADGDKISNVTHWQSLPPAPTSVPQAEPPKKEMEKK